MYSTIKMVNNRQKVAVPVIQFIMNERNKKKSEFLRTKNE